MDKKKINIKEFFQSQKGKKVKKAAGGVLGVAAAGLVIAGSIVAPTKLASFHVSQWQKTIETSPGYSVVMNVSTSGLSKDYGFHVYGEFDKDAKCGDLLLTRKDGEVSKATSITVSEDVAYIDTAALFNDFGDEIIETLGLTKPEDDSFFETFTKEQCDTAFTSINLNENGITMDDGRMLNYWLNSAINYYWSAYNIPYYHLMEMNPLKGTGQAVKTGWNNEELLEAASAYKEFLGDNKSVFQDMYLEMLDFIVGDLQGTTSDLMKALGDRAEEKFDKVVNGPSDFAYSQLLAEAESAEKWIRDNHVEASVSVQHSGADDSVTVNVVIQGDGEQAIVCDMTITPMDSIVIETPTESESLTFQIWKLEENLSADKPEVDTTINLPEGGEEPSEP